MKTKRLTNSVIRMPEASVYDLGRNIPGDWEMYKKATELINKGTYPKKSIILDLCCGTGEIVRRIKRLDQFQKIYCVDINQDYLNLCHDKLLMNISPPDKPEQIIFKFICADAVNYSLVESKANIIILSSAIHHIEDNFKKKFMKNVYRNLKDDGIVIICENLLGDFSNKEEHDKQTIDFYNKKIIEINTQKLDSYLIEIVEDIATRGIEGNCEYKMSYRIFRELLAKTSFKIDKEYKVWPKTKVFRSSKIGDFVFIVKKVGNE